MKGELLVFCFIAESVLGLSLGPLLSHHYFLTSIPGFFVSFGSRDEEKQEREAQYRQMVYPWLRQQARGQVEWKLQYSSVAPEQKRTVYNANATQINAKCDG